MRRLAWDRRRWWLRYWGPPVLVMALLFLSSSHPSQERPDDAPWLYFFGLMPIFEGVLELFIKKGVHFIAYGVLGLLFMRALVAGGMTPRRAGYLAIVLATVYAMTDELHQAFVPGRSASGLDVGLDFAGAAIFTLLARRYHYRRREEAHQGEEPTAGRAATARHVRANR